MFSALAFGLAVGASIQAWRSFPADGPLSPDAAIVLFVAGLALAYVGGRFKRSRSSSSVAVATATASSEVHTEQRVQVVVMPAGHGAAPAGLAVPADSVAWLEGPRAQITADDLDGADLSDMGVENQVVEG